MSPVIRVDKDVWAWLTQLARPLEDTPNSVLRRVAGLDKSQPHPGERVSARAGRAGRAKDPVARRARERTNSGRTLNEQWKVNARHALYHKDGNYYNHLRYFPGALFDPYGYVLFKSESEYLKAASLQHGTQLHVPDGIASIPGYVRKA